MAGLQLGDEVEVNEWLLADEDRPIEKRKQQQQQPQQVTPLPKLQIAVLLFFQLAEPLTSQCVYPFINQVCFSPVLSVGRAMSDPSLACE